VLKKETRYSSLLNNAGRACTPCQRGGIPHIHAWHATGKQRPVSCLSSRKSLVCPIAMIVYSCVLLVY
jgi:hypothetical protein